MRHLKVFESVSLEIDVQDILIDINDEEYWRAKCWLEKSKKTVGGKEVVLGIKQSFPKFIVIIDIEEYEDTEDELDPLDPPPVITNTIRRVIDFLSMSGFDNYQITFEEEHGDYEKITLDDIDGLAVWSHNFIRIEFWK